MTSFYPERGPGQGDPPSPPNWTAVADIPATGLRLLDEQLDQCNLVTSEDNETYKHEDILYADDSKFANQQAEIIQKKAELLSAFCIVLGLQLSESKLRRLLQNFLPDKTKHLAKSMTVYTTGWVPHVIPIQSTGASEFLVLWF